MLRAHVGSFAVSTLGAPDPNYAQRIDTFTYELIQSSGSPFSSR